MSKLGEFTKPIMMLLFPLPVTLECVIILASEERLVGGILGNIFFHFEKILMLS